MSYISYKILAAQRLSINPAELLDFHETNSICYATTPDGVQHTFSYAELLAPPAKNVAVNAQKGSDPPLFRPGCQPFSAIPVAKPKRKPNK